MSAPTDIPPADDHHASIDGPLTGRLLHALRRRPLTARRAVVIIGVYTFLVTVAGGVIAWVVDSKDFPRLGDGLWWALQTVTTVGYGDVVPSTGTGRVIGAFVMISGIAFLTVITAAVTASLIETARRRRPRPTDGQSSPDSLREIAERLRAIEARLDELARRVPD